MEYLESDWPQELRATLRVIRAAGLTRHTFVTPYAHEWGHMVGRTYGEWARWYAHVYDDAPTTLVVWTNELLAD
jgi:hypothetical protein